MMRRNLRLPVASASAFLYAALGATTAAASQCPSDNADLQPIARQIAYQNGTMIALPIETDFDEAMPWTLSRGGEIVEQGKTQVFGYSEGSETHIQRATVGAINENGRYEFDVCGAAVGGFDVVDAPYAGLRDDALRYFYLNRAGIDIKMPHAGGTAWTRKAGHVSETLTCFHGKDRKGRDWPGCDVAQDVSGGWYDAGDYGKYSVPAGTTLWLLLNAYERAAKTEDQANSPELTVLLEEARWGLDWLLSMQIEDGTRLTIASPADGSDDVNDTFREIDASGLVFSKVHERQWLPLPLLPENADETRFLYPPTTASTLNLAGAGAMAARIWRDRDSAYAERALSAAKRAYDAAKRHPEIYAINDFDGGGGYGDRRLWDEFAWAATELFIATGDTQYRDDLNVIWRKYRDTDPDADPLPQDLGWASYDLQSTLTLSLHAAEDTRISQKTKRSIVKVADTYLADAKVDGFSVPYPAQNYTWGSNGAVASRGIVLLEAYRRTGKAKYRQSADDILGYLTGQNPLQTSYVAGYGSQAVKHVHHRFWAEGADESFPPAPPGAMSGGPNVQSPADPVAKRLVEDGCAPQSCWEDHVDAYALNEVAIYWNAALFSLVDGLHRTGPGG